MRFYTGIIFSLIILGNAYPQKVGLVLSGGGPRGVTHVGVLKALEENNIPIDYIVGTSMGAIIGGLYSSGYTPGEIEELIKSEELKSWVTINIDPKNKYYFNQAEPNASWQLFRLYFDSGLKAKLPTNFVSPYGMDFGFIKLFAGASAAADYQFDNLYIPFRCIASDIEKSKAVALSSGRIEKAVRASMTFPFYFKPIKIDGKLMFDGGMHNNFPADVIVSEFNPDIIIGVKAASNYGPPKEDDIISQVQSMLMANTEYILDPEKGVLIEPNMWSVGVTDFSNTNAFIDSGYVKTIQLIPQIKAKIKREESIAEKNEKRDIFRNKVPELVVNKIKFKGVRPEQEVYLERLINMEDFLHHINSTSLSTDALVNELKRQYFQILSEKQIESVYPEIIHSDTGNFYTVVYNLSESKLFETEVGGLISSKAVNEIFIQMQYSYWRKYALSLSGNAYLGRFHNSGHGNARLMIPGRLPLAIELGFTANGWNYFNTSTYFIEDEDPGFLKQYDNYWSLGLNSPLSHSGKFSFVIQAGRKRDDYYQSNNFTRSDTNDITTFDFYRPAAILEFNTLNRKQYASEGYHFRLCGSYISGMEKNYPGSTSIDSTISSTYHNWVLFKMLYDGYHTVSKSLKLGFYGEAVISDRRTFNNYTASILSATAFEPLPENQTVFLPQYHAFNYLASGLKIIIPVFRTLDYRAEAYVFQPIRQILKDDDNRATRGDYLDVRYLILSTSMVYFAPFGPISISGIYLDDEIAPFQFNFSIGYYLFNKRPFN
ncbi:MAG: patatin-like phospholipase family protein [Bacteroidales bacterium]|nr:patatin-like phospholipase family protein [Bacteroidales bacterium]MCF8405217.1 patatin-like phospholipase family protein [Bacteroidales bacterium]